MASNYTDFLLARVLMCPTSVDAQRLLGFDSHPRTLIRAHALNTWLVPDVADSYRMCTATAAADLVVPPGNTMFTSTLAHPQGRVALTTRPT